MMPVSKLPCALARDGGPILGESNALLPWWSITKTVLAAAVLRLSDQGSLSLNDRFEDWPFTIRQLLQHTSRLNSYGGHIYHKAVAEGHAVWSADELLRRRDARKLLFCPGAGWAYSNIGYLFVRRLIERTTGCDLNSALRELVFEPLQIEKTRVAETAGDMAATLWGNPTNYQPQWVFHGLLVGPPSDAVQFMRGLFFGDLLSKTSRSSMQARHSTGGAVPGRPWQDTGYGLGLMMGNLQGIGQAIGHSGAGHDTVSSLYLFPHQPDVPIVAVFAQGTDEGITEHETVRLASNT